MEKFTIGIDGMSCQNCVKHVTQALTAIPGVEAVDVSLEQKIAQVQTNGTVALQVLEEAIKEAGYDIIK